MRRVGLAAFPLIFWPATAGLAESAYGRLQPHGWVGTGSEWARGLGLAFALLDVAVLVFAWLRLHRAGPTPAVKQVLFVAIVVLPLSVVFFGYHYGFDAARSVEACGSCHEMAPYVRDLRAPGSQTLAAVHFKNRYIQDDHCYTCHTDYGVFGTVKAKWEGFGHVVRHAVGRYRLPLRVAHPYASARCLNCHGDSLKFLRSPGHATGSIMPSLVAGAISCLDCHGPAHPRPTRAGTR